VSTIREEVHTVPGLPRKRFETRHVLVNPERGSGLQVAHLFSDRAVLSELGQQMNVVRDAVDDQCDAALLPHTTGEKAVHLGADAVGNQGSRFLVEQTT